MNETPKREVELPEEVKGLPPAHSATPKRSWMWLAGVLATLLGAAVFASVVGYILYGSLDQKVHEQTLDISHLQAQSEPEEEEEDETPTDIFAGRSVNILLMGIDARTGQDAQIINPEDDDVTMRSDTTLLMHVAEDRESVTIVSLPRDMWVELPQCRRSDGSISPSQWGQFNWAFSYGAQTNDLAAGVACTESTVKSLTGFRPDAFAVIDFTGFSRMVEALGGVEVCLDEAISDTRYLDLELEAGCQVLDPITATQYARVRYVGDGSDMGRIQRQQDLLGAMALDALDSNLLTDLPSLYAFLTTSIESTKVSSSLSNLRADAGFANSLKDIDPENIRFITMPTLVADFDANRLLPEEPENRNLWEAIYNDRPLPVGTVFMDINGDYFTVLEDGEVQPGGEFFFNDMGSILFYTSSGDY